MELGKPKCRWTYTSTGIEGHGWWVRIYEHGRVCFAVGEGRVRSKSVDNGNGYVAVPYPGATWPPSQ